MAAREPVPVRSYRAVVDDVERRIYRVDRWRLPMPGGIEVRAIVYTVAAFIALAAAGNLPFLGSLISVLPPGIRYLALPVLCGWGLSVWRIDGRAPHHALVGALRFGASTRSLSGLRSSPPAGTSMAPLAGLRVAGTDEARYRAGRVRGPARVVLRYPARVEVRGELARAKRIRIEGVGKRVRPLARGQAIEVPEGAEVRVG